MLTWVRGPSDSQIAQIARSIDSFGFNVPIAVYADYKVLAGHGRLLAAQKLDWKAVPAIRLTHLTAAQARAFAIADNENMSARKHSGSEAVRTVLIVSWRLP